MISAVTAGLIALTRWGSMLFHRRTIANVAAPVDLMQLRRTARILVIDDQPESFPTDLLQTEGYSVEWWPSVRDLRRLEQGGFDIIFLDIHGVAKSYGADDGAGVLAAIKRTNPTQIVVAFSGQSFDLSKMDFWKGADAGLKKPVDFLTAKETIDRMLARLTAPHFWTAISAILRAHGTPDKEIRKIESRLAAIIEKKSSKSLKNVFSAVMSNDDVVSVLITLGGRLLALSMGAG